jgi:hypothetical protein
VILVLMMIYRPTGLLPAARRKRELTERTEADPEATENGADHV